MAVLPTVLRVNHRTFSWENPTVRRAIAYPLAALGAVASTMAVASPPLAHGYVVGAAAAGPAAAVGGRSGRRRRADPVRAAERRGPEGPEVVRRRAGAVLRAG